MPEVREAQADLARQYGVYGFCYYHYWFNGRRILERPLDEVLATEKPDFPFCICWANENWTRRWEGNTENVLLEQHYSAEDDAAHIQHLLRTLEDPRYIRIEGKLLVLFYRIELLPDPRHTAEIWRSAVRKAGLGDLFLVNVQSNFVRHPRDSASMGFDAAVRFQPNLYSFQFSSLNSFTDLRALRSPKRNDRVFSYGELYRRWRSAPSPGNRSFECVTPMWDNSPRREREPYVEELNTREYEAWLRDAVRELSPIVKVIGGSFQRLE